VNGVDPGFESATAIVVASAAVRFTGGRVWVASMA
jgi:hypothetical protein